MKKVKLKETDISPKIWKWVWDTLEEISHEVGTEENGEYILVYEGWSGVCVSRVFDPKKSERENEDRYYKYADEQSDDIIKEWLEGYKETHHLIDCGYEPIGLYGVTWALFKRSKNSTIYLRWWYLQSKTD